MDELLNKLYFKWLDRSESGYDKWDLEASFRNIFFFIITGLFWTVFLAPFIIWFIKWEMLIWIGSIIRWSIIYFLLVVPLFIRLKKDN